MMINSFKKLSFRLLAILLAVTILFTTDASLIISTRAESFKQLNSDEKRSVSFLTKNKNENICIYYWNENNINGFETGLRKEAQKDGNTYYLWEFSIPLDATYGKFTIDKSLEENNIITNDLEIRANLSNHIYYRDELKNNLFINFNDIKLKSTGENFDLQKGENRDIVSYDELKSKFKGTLINFISVYHFYEGDNNLSDIHQGDVFSYTALNIGKHNISVSVEDIFGNVYNKELYCTLKCRTNRENFDFLSDEMSVIFGSECEIQKLNGEFQGVTYSSSDESIVKIYGTSLQLLKTGTVEIQAKIPQTDKYNEQTAKYSLEVRKGNVEDNQVYFNAEGISIEYGDEFDNPVIFYNQDMYKDAKVTYSSSDTSTVSVDENGKIKALKVSTEPVTITAYITNLGNYNDIQKKYTVNVIKAHIKATVQDKEETYSENMEIELDKLVSIEDVETYNIDYSILSQKSLENMDINGQATIEGKIFRAERSGIFIIRVIIEAENYKNKELKLKIKVNRAERKDFVYSDSNYIVGCSYTITPPIETKTKIEYSIDDEYKDYVSLYGNKITAKKPVESINIKVHIRRDARYKKADTSFNVKIDYYKPAETELFYVEGTYVNENDKTKFKKDNIIIKPKEGYKIALYNSDKSDFINYEFSNEIRIDYNTKNPKIVMKLNDIQSKFNGAITNIIDTGIYLDKNAPTGEIKINEIEEVFINLVSTITFGLFIPECHFSIKAYDNMSEEFESGNVEIKYFIQNFENEEEQNKTFEEPLEQKDWKNYNANLSYNKDGNIVIYAKLTDGFGNISFISTDGVVIDSSSPIATISYDNNHNSNYGNYYDTSRTARISVLDDNFVGSSDMIDISVDNDINKPKIVWENDKSCIIEFKDDAHYHIEFTDKFKDKAGNRCEIAVEDGTNDIYDFIIDTKSPEIKLSYNNNNGKDGYYKESRKAIIEVIDDNFEGNCDMIEVTAKDSNGNSVVINNIEWNGNIGTILFDKDAVYEFGITEKFSDKAGHKGILSVADGTEDYDKFVIDTKSPQIELSYNNNNGRDGYYKKSRIATIKVVDDNFKGSSDMVEIIAKDSNNNIIDTNDIEWNGDTGTILFDKDAIYEFKITEKFEDKAGHKGILSVAEGTKDCNKFVIDKTSPKLKIAYDNNNSANRYYNNQRIATLTVDDVNFVYSNNMINISAKDVNGDTIKKNGTDFTPEIKWNNNVAKIDFSENANYEFKVTDEFTDMAGNPVEIYIDKSTKDPYSFTVDRTAPDNIVVKYTDIEETFTGTLEKFISFVTGGIVYFKGKVLVNITASDDISGIDRIEYSAPIETNKNESGLVGIENVIEQYGDGKEKLSFNFEIPAEYKGKVRAKAFNKAGLSTETNESIIAVSDKKPKITLDILNSEDAIIHNSVMYFNEDVKIGITVEDVFFDVKSEKNNLSIRETTDRDGIKNTKEIIPLNEWQRLNNNENKYYNEFELSDEGDKILEVSYINYSGNSADNKIINTIVIDKTSPVVEIAYDNNNPKNEIFYNVSRTATLTVTDDNFEGLQEMIKITAKDVNGRDLNTPNINWRGNVGTIRFDDSAEYKFEITDNFVDKAGNNGIIKIADNIKNPYNFIVDKVNPKVVISYDNNFSEEGGYYYNNPRTVTVTVTEDYFEPDNTMINVKARDINNRELPSPKVEWTGKTAKIKFSDDAIYILNLSMSFVDRAGNMFVNNTDTETQKDIYEFVVDKTKPTDFKITYTSSKDSILGALENLSALITGGIVYFQDKVTANISAKDITSGIDRIEYSANVNTDKGETGLDGIKFTIKKNERKSEDFSVSFDIPAEYKGNIKATAYNKAGLSTSKTDGKIAVSGKKPEISFSVSNISDSIKHNEVAYFNEDIKIKLTVEDVFFNAEKVQITEITNNKNAIISPSSEWKRENNTNKYYCDVILKSEGNKKLEVKYTNNSRISAETKLLNNLVIDKTSPEVEIRYDNNKSFVKGGYYYQSGRSATIRVNDVNFEPTITMIDLSAKNALGNNIEKPFTNWNGKVCTINFKNDAYYTMNFTNSFVDKAGNTVKVKIADGTKDVYKFAIDTVAPEAMIEIRDTSSNLINKVSVNNSGVDKVIYCNKAVDIVISAEDNLALKENLDVKYNIDASVESVNTKNYTSPIRLEPDRKFKISTVVTDQSGRKVECTSDIIILDRTAPDVDGIPPEIKFGFSKNNPKIDKNGRILYNDNVLLDLTVIDPIVNNSCSGLDISKLKYKVLKDGQVTQNGNLSGSLEDYDGRPRILRGTINVDASLNNSNNVEVIVEAEDNSENLVIESANLSIDITNPNIDISYSNNTADNENTSYFNTARTAEIKITERNFDENDVIIKATKDSSEYNPQLVWKHSGVNGTDDYTHIAYINYSEDGDYTFDISYSDEASNHSNKVNYGNSKAYDSFTIDLTNPQITLNYDNNSAMNGNYYKNKRVATITVYEHNFDPKRFSYVCSATNDGKAITAPEISGWSSSGDVHIATVSFDNDAKFKMNISFNDMAGNQSNNVSQQEFYVDTKPPKISVNGITYKSANNYNGNIGFVLSATDENVNISSFKIKFNRVDINGAGESFVGIGKKETNSKGVFYCVDNVKNDGIYMLTCEISDMAGNVTTIVNIDGENNKKYNEQEIIFSVNRMGSTFMLDGNTKKMVSNKYVKQVENDIVITEFNPDTVNKYSVVLIKNSDEIKALSDGTNYSRSVEEDKEHWKIYKYKINKENFSDEGAYSLAVTTYDTAKNTSYSETKNPDYSSEPVAKVDFVVDRTIPHVVVTNIEDGGHYNVDTKSVDIVANDDNLLQSLKITLNGEVVKEYNEKQLDEIQGRFSLNISSSKSLQNLKIEAVDAAHNSTEDSESTSINFKNFLITTNIWIQFINNPILVIASILITLLLITIVFLTLRKKRKNN